MSLAIPAAGGVAARLLERLVYPTVCPLCRARRVAPALPGPGLDSVAAELCADCRGGLHTVVGPWCLSCGGTLDTVLTSCNECLRQTRRWRSGATVFRYTDLPRRLVHRYKYRGQIALVRPFAAFAAEAWRERLDHRDQDCLVPVPLHWYRYYRRGYNQTELLADALAPLLGLPVLHALRRIRYTGSQTYLTRAQRRTNLARAFAPRAGVDIAGRRVLLLDDVLTTGATLDACSRQLLKAGAASVDVLTIARG